MKSVKIYQYDAFTNQAGKGNPAGIILNDEVLTDEEMQRAAEKAGFTEIAIPLTSDQADLKLRYFSPKREMDLCGHATVAALYALKTKGLLPEKERLTIETKAGILPVRIHSATENNWQITMTQKPASFEPFNGSRDSIAQVIGLNASDIDGSFPLLYGSTGSWTLLVPVKGLSPFKRMHSFNDQFPEVLERFPDASIHPFCQETIHSANDLHGRHFSSPGTGSIEDPVTGTASGVMGAYFAKFMADEISDSYKIAVEQGQEIGKDGRVYVDVSRQGDNLSVTITGEAVYVKTLNLKV